MESEPTPQVNTPHDTHEDDQVQGNMTNGNDLIAPAQINGDQIDAQGSQGFVNRPSGTVTQNFGPQYVVRTLDDIPLSPEAMLPLLTHYRQRLLAETQYVKLEGIPLRDEDLTSKIPLQRIYIHIQTLERRQSQKLRHDEEQALHDVTPAAQQEHQRLDLFDLISRLGEHIYRRGESVESSQRPAPVDPLEAIGQHRHLVLLGAPGAGKSTLLRYLAHQMSRDEQDKVVMLVTLNAFAFAYRQNRQLSLVEWALTSAAPHNLQLRRALHEACENRDVLWLFDGLDETGDLREETSRQISGLADKAQIVVTSRSLDYRRTHLENFAHFEVLPLTTTHVEHFITDWLTILAEEQGYTSTWIKECSDWLEQQLATRPRIRALTQNPLLLTFLVILARHNPRHDLPDQRYTLYQRYIAELFTTWEQHRRSDTVSLSPATYLWGIEVIAWYLHLAYFGRTQKNGQTEVYLPNRTSLQQWLTKVLQQERGVSQSDMAEMAEQIIRFWIHTGLLEEREWQATKLLTFRHLTFQEYGAARVLHTTWQKDSARTWRFLRPRLHHGAWRESLLLLSEQMDTVAIDRFVQYLLGRPSPYERTLHRDLLLAASLAGESQNISTPLIKRTVKRLSWHLQSHDLLEDFYWLACAFVLVIGCSAVVMFGALLFTGVLRWLWLLAWIILFRVLVIDTAEVLSLIKETLLKNTTIRAALFLATRMWQKNAALQKEMTEALVRLKDEQSIFALLAGLKDRQPKVRQYAAEALGKLDNRKSVQSLIALLKDRDVNVQRNAAIALGRLGDTQSIEPLIALFGDEDSTIRYSAAYALGQFRSENVLEPLVVALKNASPHVRDSASQAMGNLRDGQAVAPLIGALKDTDHRVRWHAIEALGKLGEVALPPLIQALQAQDAYVSSGAAKALGELGDGRAVAPLKDVLNHQDSDVRSSALRALERIHNVTAKPSQPDLSDQRNRIGASKIEGLQPIYGASAIKALIRSLNNRDIGVRWSAVQTLGRLDKGHLDGQSDILLKTIARALWWRLTDYDPIIVDKSFTSLSHVVSRFPVMAPIDDLLLPK